MLCLKQTFTIIMYLWLTSFTENKAENIRSDVSLFVYSTFTWNTNINTTNNTVFKPLALRTFLWRWKNGNIKLTQETFRKSHKILSNVRFELTTLNAVKIALLFALTIIYLAGLCYYFRIKRILCLVFIFYFNKK